MMSMGFYGKLLTGVPVNGIKHLAVCSVLFALLPAVASADIEQASEFKFRARAAVLELDDDNQGEAMSLRLRWTHEARLSDSISSIVEVDGVAEFFEDRHSNGVHFNGKPVIPDVEGIDLNQAALKFEALRSEFTLGRQRILVDNERFIGGAGYWQNEQTFDAVQIRTRTLQSSSLSITYIGRANRVFGRNAGTYLNPMDENFETADGQRPKVRLGVHEHDSYMVRFDMDEWDYAKLSLFHHRIENKTAQLVSNSTSGLSYRFKYKYGRHRFHAKAVHARQERMTIKLDGLNYSNVVLGWGIAGATFFAEYESLEGNGTTAFVTPLASLHEHQGWTDKFLITPSAGISDISLRLLWRFSPWRLDLRYHQFADSDHDTEFGTELDASLIYHFSRTHALTLHFADFQAHPDFPLGLTDTKNIYLTYDYQF